MTEVFFNLFCFLSFGYFLSKILLKFFYNQGGGSMDIRYDKKIWFLWQEGIFLRLESDVNEGLVSLYDEEGRLIIRRRFPKINVIQLEGRLRKMMKSKNLYNQAGKKK